MPFWTFLNISKGKRMVSPEVVVTQYCHTVSPNKSHLFPNPLHFRWVDGQVHEFFKECSRMAFPFIFRSAESHSNPPPPQNPQGAGTTHCALGCVVHEDDEEIKWSHRTKWICLWLSRLALPQDVDAVAGGLAGLCSVRTDKHHWLWSLDGASDETQ